MYCSQVVAGVCRLLIAWVCVQASISPATSHSSNLWLVRSWGDHPTSCASSWQHTVDTVSLTTCARHNPFQWWAGDHTTTFCRPSSFLLLWFFTSRSLPIHSHSISLSSSSLSLFPTSPLSLLFNPSTLHPLLSLSLSPPSQALVQGFCTKVATVVENMILTGEGEELVRAISLGYLRSSSHILLSFSLFSDPPASPSCPLSLSSLTLLPLPPASPAFLFLPFSFFTSLLFSNFFVPFLPSLQMLDEVRAAGSQKKGTSLAGCMTADLIVLLREIPTGRSRGYVSLLLTLCLQEVVW